MNRRADKYGTRKMSVECRVMSAKPDGLLINDREMRINCRELSAEPSLHTLAGDPNTG